MLMLRLRGAASCHGSRRGHDGAGGLGTRSLRGRSRQRPTTAPASNEVMDTADTPAAKSVDTSPPPPPPQNPRDVAAAVRQRRATETTPFAGQVGLAALRRKPYRMPAWLQEAAVKVVQASGLPGRLLRKDCERMHEFLFSREVVPGVPAESSLHGTAYAPQLHYGARESIAYFACRHPVCYAAAATVFDEVVTRVPAFRPTSMLDFGSGAGLATVAAAHTWRDALVAATCVDASSDMTRLAQDLFDAIRTGGSESTGGDDDGSHDTRGPMNDLVVHHRAMLPGTKSGSVPPYDLVVASFSLCEISSARLRSTVLRTLWDLTAGCLVVIESGNRQGFSLISEARADMATWHEGEGGDRARSDSNKTPIMVSPCPHLGTCPRAGTAIPCHFPIRAEYPSGLRFTRQEQRHGRRDEKLSYLVMARPEMIHSASGPVPTLNQPRIVRQPQRHPGNIAFEVCHATPDTINEVVVPRSVSKAEWEDAKGRAWGDTFPPYSKRFSASTDK
eukprot:m.8058 g.8058  ORF g.8058 m.8058 type:complete len:504 (-) comp2499_c0_seq1:1134-2645(-)